MASPATQQRMAIARTREAKAVDLRLAGVTFEAIAQQVGYSSASEAHKAYTRAVARDYPPAQREQAAAMEALRLERLRRAVWTAAMRGDTRAVDSALRITDRLCKLLGLDAPTKVEITSEVDAQIQALAASLSGGVYTVTDA